MQIHYKSLQGHIRPSILTINEKWTLGQCLLSYSDDEYKDKDKYKDQYKAKTDKVPERKGS